MRARCLRCSATRPASWSRHAVRFSRLRRARVPHSPLLLQLVVILGTARLLGLAAAAPWAAARDRRDDRRHRARTDRARRNVPAVRMRSVFEPSSLPALDGLSQVGLVLFMFIVGAELRAPHGARQQLIAAGWISVMSVLVPMAFGWRRRHCSTSSSHRPASPSGRSRCSWPRRCRSRRSRSWPGS